MGKSKYTKGVTAMGEAFFTNVLSTEKFTKDGKTTDTGKYSIMLKLSQADLDEMKVRIDDEWESYKNTLDVKKFKYDYVSGVKEYKDEEYLKFTMPATIKCKSGEVIEMHVPVFDSVAREISKKLHNELGNGSKVKVAYELRPFYMSDKNYGISLRLVGIQVIELVEYGNNSASALGFGVVAGGFKASDAEKADVDDENDDDIPFVEHADDDDEEVDF